MSAWRARALELFPSLTSEIEAADSVVALWVELSAQSCSYYVRQAHTSEAPALNLIRSICLYAVWCTRSPSLDVQQAAWIEFYEELPHFAMHAKPETRRRIVKDLVENLGIEEIERTAGTMGGRLTPDQLKTFLRDARQAELQGLKHSQ
jgi:hypothetical protein